MGCGASSGTQISPISTEPPLDFKNGTSNSNCSKPNSASSREQPPLQPSRFNFGFLFPCKFYGATSSSIANASMAKRQCNSAQMQTESDIHGFKCQYSQSDSFILSDAEMEAMIVQLENELKGAPEECKVVRIVDDNFSDIEDESGLKSWKGIIKAHKDGLDSVKKFANKAIQATRPKATSATQTKFGSIDHQFVPNSYILFSKSPQHFLEQNDLLTKTLSENLLKVIEQPSSLSTSLDQHLTSLLSSFEDEEDCLSPQMPEGEPNKIVDSIQKTLATYHSASRKHSVDRANSTDGQEEKQQQQQPQPPPSHPNEILVESEVTEVVIPVTTANSANNPRPMMDTRRRLKEAQKRLKLLKQQKFHDCLEMILGDIRNKRSIDELLPAPVTAVKKRDVSLQTTNDILTDEAPHFAARPPLCHKNEMIPSVLMFRDIDRKMHEAAELTSVHEIGEFVLKQAKNDLFKIRALFVWVSGNIQLSCEQHREENLVSAQILERKEATSKDYCQLFADLCRTVGIRVKTVEGFVRNYDYRPGYHFKQGQDPLSYWSAVFVLSSWRFIDLSLAAGYMDGSGEFHQNLNEHYFLTDPSMMIWTHFPFSELESEYERWQLLDKPFTIEQFNSLPKVTENFFEYNLSVRSRMESPLTFRISTDIKIGSHEAMRYKYKFYPAEEIENSSLNHYVFCQLKDDRLIGSFMVHAPIEDRFLLKIFAKPEREMHGSQQDLSANLNPILTFLLECTKARKYIEPLPISELPWGPTQKFFEYKLRLINQKGPTIVTWGGRRRLVIEANETMLLTYSLFDSESMEMDARTVISREDLGLKTTFTINPPRVGTFKLMLFGMPKPKQKGKWRLPLLATFLIDCKLIKPPQHDEDMLQGANASDDGKGDKKQKGKK